MAKEMESDRLRAALSYAAIGWPVFPLWGVVNGACECPKGAACGRNSGKHPRHSGGHNKASTNQNQIAGWWQSWPNANIGIATGPAKLFVLDVDPPGNGHGDGDGPATLAELERKHGALPMTPEARTGSGGRHVYFLAPDGADVPSSGAKMAPGLDWRATKGHVVAPPSRHYLGDAYTWVDGRSPEALPVAPAPGWLVDLARASRKGARPTRATTGDRNNLLASFAGTVRRTGATPEVVEAKVLARNASHCVPPLPEDEARAIARSIAKYPAGDNRGDNAKGRLSTLLFTPCPWELLQEGGAIDTLSDKAWRLLWLMLSQGAIKKTGDVKAFSGIYGERSLTYKYINRRFGWKDDKIGRALRELEDKDFVRVARQGGPQAGYHVASSYEIGAAHPWSDQKAAPDWGGGPAPDLGGGASCPAQGTTP